MARKKVPEAGAAGAVLEFSTAVKRRTVEIDGKKLEMLNRDELSLAAGIRLHGVLKEVANRERITEAQAMMLSVSLAKAVKDVLPQISDETLSKLSDDKRCLILATFLEATGKPAPMTAAASPART